MIITDVSVRKVAKDDPRYPEQPATGRHFTDVYLLTAMLDDGSAQECPFFVMDGQEFDTSRCALMLKAFAHAIERMAAKEAA